ncbi:MAG: hypothetical protein AAB677_01885 [Patescibacteria group bacterium]
MIKNSSFRLACALLGLLIIILPFLGLPDKFKTVLFVIFGLLTVLFSLAEISGQGVERPENIIKNVREGEKPNDHTV